MYYEGGFKIAESYYDCLINDVLLPIIHFSPHISTMNQILGNIYYPQLCISYAQPKMFIHIVNNMFIDFGGYIRKWGLSLTCGFDRNILSL
jgi:hypothetical protein